MKLPKQASPVLRDRAEAQAARHDKGVEPSFFLPLLLGAPLIAKMLRGG